MPPSDRPNNRSVLNRPPLTGSNTTPLGTAQPPDNVNFIQERQKEPDIAPEPILNVHKRVRIDDLLNHEPPAPVKKTRPMSLINRKNGVCQRWLADHGVDDFRADRAFF